MFYKTRKNTGNRGIRFWNNAYDAFEHCANDDTDWPMDAEAFIGNCLYQGDHTITKITEAEYDAG